MSDQAYMVVFRGELVEGADLQQVKEKLQTLCKLTEEKVEHLFTLPAVVLRKNLTEASAHACRQQLESIGVLSDIKGMEEAKVVAVSQTTLNSASDAEPATSDDSSGQPPNVAETSPESAASDEAEASGSLDVQFHGNGGEYFKIWIVNVFLSILTLGIYSAWAKVRNHRYFYSNTQIGSGSFEYTADPIAILKGRIIAVVFFILFSWSQTAMPFLYAVLFVIFIVALPWLINRSMAFRNRNTKFRNVRFGFRGSYLDALKAFVLWPVAGFLSIGILMPYAIYKQKQFLVNGSFYGTSQFEPEFGWRGVYKAAVIAFLIMVLAGLVFGLGSLLGPLAFISIVAGMAFYLLAFAYFNANMGNLIYNGSHLVKHRFESTLETTSLAKIYLINGVTIILTLGLAMPWAKVRLARYRAEHLTVLVDGSLDQFIASEEEQVNSLGEEIGEAFDIDIGL